MRRAKAVGRQIRREVEPRWEPAAQARVLRRVLAAAPARPSRRWPIALAVTVAAGLVAMLAWRSIRSLDVVNANSPSMAPMHGGLPASASGRASTASPPRGMTSVAREPAARESGANEPTANEPRPSDHNVNQPPPPPSTAPSVTHDERPAEDQPATAPDLLEAADAARRAGSLARATRLLRRVIAETPKHRDIAAARMALARVLEQRQRFGEAARAYETLLDSKDAGHLREDAQAGAARAYERHGDHERARSHAQTYLERYPAGLHATAIEGLLQATATP